MYTYILHAKVMNTLQMASEQQQNSLATFSFTKSLLTGVSKVF